MSLQERVRYFEYMRPRYSNPSYASNNVGVSLGVTFTPDQIKSKPILRNLSDVPQVQPAANQQDTAIQPKLQKTGRRSKSNLSSYGTSSLGTLPKFINQRDIYEKQEKKYNIITILPKQYNQTIKKYPKYHLEHMDQNYYRKLKLQQEYNPKNFNIQPNSKPIINPERQRRYQPVQAPPVKLTVEIENQVKPQKGFRPKMLNNIDELSGVL